MYYFYVLQSSKTARRYKGSCENLELRLRQHNSGRTKSTKSGIPWKIIYTESFETRTESILREKYYKTFKGGKELKSKIG